MKGKMSLLAWCTEHNRTDIIEEWAHDLNGITPSVISYGSTKKVWWRCTKDASHVWDSNPNSRTSQTYQGCPFCSHHRILIGNNDLTTTHPHIAAEWDYEKNGDFLPTMAVENTNRKVWWKCSVCGQSWSATVSSRAHGGSGCPYCANLKIAPGQNDLATLFPSLMEEWDYSSNVLDPHTIAAGTSRKANWICKVCGHKWSAAISSRTSSGTGCPQCARVYQTSKPEKIVAAYLAQYETINQNVKLPGMGIMEADIYLPQRSVIIEYDGALFHANTEGDAKKDEIAKSLGYQIIRLREQDCPEYSSSAVKIQLTENDGNYLYLIPAIKKVAAILNSRYDAIIPESFDAYEEIVNIIIAGDRRKVDNPVSNYPCSKDWDYEKNVFLKPEDIPAGSHFFIHWKCSKCGYLWDSAAYTRTGMGCGCPQCAGQVATESHNLLIDGYVFVKEWNYERNDITPDHYLPQSNIKVWWRCSSCGHEWQASISHRYRGRGCPLCAHQVVIPGKNDLQTLYPLIACEWMTEKNGCSADTVSGGSQKKYWWKCKICGYEWPAIVASRTKNGNGCPSCAGNVLVRGKNDLATLYPQIAEEWDFEKNSDLPSDVTGKNNRKAHWICSRGHSYCASINSRTSRGSGCPYCSGQKVLPGFNDLSTTRPDLLIDWDYEKNTFLPTEVTAGTDKKAWWKCSVCGNEWEASIGSRSRGHGCVRCFRMKKR